MFKKFKNIFPVLWQGMLLLGVLHLMFNIQLWIYLMGQAKGQLNIIFHTQQIQNMLSHNEFNTEDRRKVLLIQEIKLFAEEQLGLKKTSNYSTFYDQQGKPVLWMLTACKPYSFEEKEWQFPLLGIVSYKGFFEYEKGQKEAIALKLQHYDVDLGKVSAWSTLGILSDPVLSSMLDDDEGELAELIIHELTHATLYFANQVDFNENFASFVGRQGALRFITYKYGEQSREMQVYLQNLKEEDTLKSFLLNQKEQLTQFYYQLKSDLSEQEKARLKAKKFDEIIRKLYHLPIYNWKTKIKIAKRIRISGNAYFMSFNRYDAQYEMLMKLFKAKGSDIKRFIEFAKQHKFEGN